MDEDKDYEYDEEELGLYPDTCDDRDLDPDKDDCLEHGGGVTVKYGYDQYPDETTFGVELSQTLTELVPYFVLTLFIGTAAAIEFWIVSPASDGSRTSRRGGL